MALQACGPAHCRFQAATAPVALTDSTTRGPAGSVCETTRPKSVLVALRSVRLKRTQQQQGAPPHRGLWHAAAHPTQRGAAGRKAPGISGTCPGGRSGCTNLELAAAAPAPQGSHGANTGPDPSQSHGRTGGGSAFCFGGVRRHSASGSGRSLEPRSRPSSVGSAISLADAAGASRSSTANEYSLGAAANTGDGVM
eukprot:CAMPEP_0179322294 /NCGR_PEP_ID=MMETSP0797-20121207/59092_1 /TAXON_ID=47934 /ORGANISM="Dinophysis acuminata, Strain DAEP01" /LENGTH=195 /DNA_ID=CAMNT_0021034023 /DNA_START=34 /DNA_END=621 /DNA_ORIENTATION=+